MSTHSERATDLKAIALRTISDQDCRTFISQLTIYAIDCDKQSDDEWIAEIAALRIEDDALNWYTDLDVETQQSWQKLRRAILKEIKLRSAVSSTGNSLAAVPPPSLIPTPAAAIRGSLNIDHVFRTGRIRVEAADPQCSGYLSSDLNEYGCIDITKQTHNALTVRYNRTNDFPILEITNPGRENTALGVHWGSDPNEGSKYYCNGVLVIVDSATPITSSWTTARGPCEAAAFLIQPNLSLLIFSDVSSDRYLLDTFIHKKTKYPQFCVSYDEFIDKRGIGGYFCRVKFKIEVL